VLARLMSSTTLLIFEGVSTEQNIVNNLEDFFFVDTGNTVVRASYGHNIYQLYEAFNDDDGLDLIGIIQEKIATRETITAYDQVILIAVISAFPLMLHQHYGDKLFVKMTNVLSLPL
jgi:hypothetical protein